MGKVYDCDTFKETAEKGGCFGSGERNPLLYAEYDKRRVYDVPEKSLIDKLYDGSTKNFVAALCQNGELTEADIDELKSYFRMGDKNT